MARKVSTKKISFLLGLLAIGAIVVFLVPRLISVGDSSSRTEQVGTKSARESTILNKEFEFPVDPLKKDSKKIKMVIEKAELLDEIIVKGQKATAVSGRTFLILNIKILNDLENQLTMNTRDYIRLKVNKNEELLAPEIHNDPVEVQAISTKYTRLGFPVNVSDKDFELLIGEIKGEKQKIELPFNK